MRDPVNDLILPLIGAGILVFLLMHGWITFDMIKILLTEGIR
jgi:hypothetical protein